MATTGRVVIGVIAGAVLWAVLWIGGTTAAQAAFPELLDPSRRLEHVGALLGYIAYSVLLSLLAGYAAAAVAGLPAAMRAVWALAVVQLAIGVFFEISYWTLLPVWYHVLFLLLIVPATVLGGRLRTAARPTTLVR